MTRAVATFKINVLDGSARPAWRNSMSQWQWKRLTGTAAFSGVTPTVKPEGSYSARLNAWNGFCAKDASVYIAGMGGHADYAGNEAYKLDLSAATPAWVLLNQPTPAAQVLYESSYYADGRPTSTHLYYALFTVGNELLRTDAGSVWGTGNKSDKECVAFSLSTNDWRPDGTYPDAPGDGSYAWARCIDPRDETIYFAGYANLHKRNPLTGAWTQLARWPENGSATYYRPGVVDTTRNRILFVGNGYVPANGSLLYDIASGTMSAVTMSGVSVSQVVGPDGNTAWYLPATDRFIVKTKVAGNVYIIHPTTFECAPLSVTGVGPTDDSYNGVFNKFVYVPQLGGFYYQAIHDADGWFLASE